MEPLSSDILRRRLALRVARPIPPGDLRSASVLVPVLPGPGGAELLLTLRTHTVETHKGQVAFPGGTADDGDRDPVDTALREAEEELGLGRASVEVVGMLDDLETPTGFHVTPVVGWVADLPPLVPNPKEVAEVFRVPLGFFADPASGRTEARLVRGKEHPTWIYTYGGRTIWGVSAAIIRSFLSRLTAS